MPSELDSTAEVNSTYPHGFPGTSGVVVVRAEEALIVVFVLVLWVAAIALFFNRWGKIRMLEPYQPKFQQQHRQSCAIVDPAPLSLRTCSKFNIHCLEHPLYPGENQRPRQNSVFVGSSVSLLPNDRDAPRRAKSAFDLQSLVHAECTVQSTMDEQQDTIEMEPEFLSCTLRGQSLTNNGRLKPFNEYPKASRSFQRERGASICHFDRTDVLARPLQRERGMSICQFDRMDVLARPLQRDRGMSICHFDRMDVLAHPTHFRGSRASIASNVEKLENLTKSSLQRDSRVSMSFNHASIDKPACPENFHRFTGFSVQRDCRPNVATHLEKAESVARFLQRDSRSSLGNNERGMIIENLEAGKNGTNGQSVGSIGCSSKDRGSLVSPHDRPSCSKTPDVVLGYKATCV